MSHLRTFAHIARILLGFCADILHKKLQEILRNFLSHHCIELNLLSVKLLQFFEGLIHLLTVDIWLFLRQL